jgi:hypothetical protein
VHAPSSERPYFFHWELIVGSRLPEDLTAAGRESVRLATAWQRAGNGPVSLEFCRVVTALSPMDTGPTRNGPARADRTQHEGRSLTSGLLHQRFRVQVCSASLASRARVCPATGAQRTHGAKETLHGAGPVGRRALSGRAAPPEGGRG